jgi:hypothetical protein
MQTLSASCQERTASYEERGTNFHAPQMNYLGAVHLPAADFSVRRTS